MKSCTIKSSVVACLKYFAAALKLVSVKRSEEKWQAQDFKN